MQECPIFKLNFHFFVLKILKKNSAESNLIHQTLSRVILITETEQPTLCQMFSSVQLLSNVQLFVTSWTEAGQASLSITNSQTILKLMSIVSVMPSNHLILCRPLLLLPSIFPSIRVFSKESALRIRWPKYWSFSIISSSEYVLHIYSKYIA